MIDLDAYRDLASSWVEEGREAEIAQETDEWLDAVEALKKVTKHYEGEEVAKGLSITKPSPEPEPIEKGLSPNFGRRGRRQAQLMRRLRGARNYDDPVRGGTGKQYRTRRTKFRKGLGIDKPDDPS